ncbi:MAG: MCE family protein [Bdellovibrionaceae bacterium]|nr:MCE family protein [Pseudobdellovibrionaceae bacterium]
MNPQTTRQIRSVRSNWYLWLFPLFAVLISAWLFREYFTQRGSTLMIAFSDASGLQPEKTRVRFRGVTIGVVKKVTISEDGKDVIAHVLLQRDAEHFAVKGSKFWVVLPNVNFQGVSGLETLFEGTYIAAQPGSAKGPRETAFKGHIGAETTESLEDTIIYYLETDQLGSVSVGNAVTFRGLKVGVVSLVNLSKDSRTVIVQINIQKKYTKLVRTNSIFWRKVGVQANLGFFSAEVKINSLESLMRGGIDLWTPENAGPIAEGQSKFTLSASPPKGWEKWNPKLEFSE